jgi:hypothetical protein
MRVGEYRVVTRSLLQRNGELLTHSSRFIFVAPYPLSSGRTWSASEAHTASTRRNRLSAIQLESRACSTSLPRHPSSEATCRTKSARLEGTIWAHTKQSHLVQTLIRLHGITTPAFASFSPKQSTLISRLQHVSRLCLRAHLDSNPNRKKKRGNERS